MSAYTDNENIHIAFIGPISAGKTTLMNALFSAPYSCTGLRATTHVPQIYQTCHDPSMLEDHNRIQAKNKNATLHAKTTGEFCPVKHIVEPIKKFIKLPCDKATYSVLDMPGLNCTTHSAKYYDYISAESAKIDIYVLVFDIKTGSDTTDEKRILEHVVRMIQSNNGHGYVHVLLNKCDHATWENDELYDFPDAEFDELYESFVANIEQLLEPLARPPPELMPICAKSLYLYRCAVNNPKSLVENDKPSQRKVRTKDGAVSCEHLDALISLESGKEELKKCTTVDDKLRLVAKMVRDGRPSDWMRNTGYNNFVKNIQQTIDTHYRDMVMFHIEGDVRDLLEGHNTMATDDMVRAFIVLVERVTALNNKATVSAEKERVPLQQDFNTIIDSIDRSIRSEINRLDNDDEIIWCAEKSIQTVEELYGHLETGAIDHNQLKRLVGFLREKCIEPLNNRLEARFEKKIFKKLWPNSVSRSGFRIGLTNRLKSSDTGDVIKILESIKHVTQNENDYVVMSVGIVVDNLDKITNPSMPAILQKIAQVIDDQAILPELLHQSIAQHLAPQPYVSAVPDWIGYNRLNMANDVQEIRFIFYRVNDSIHRDSIHRDSIHKDSIHRDSIHKDSHGINMAEYVEMGKQMNAIYDVLKKIYRPKSVFAVHHLEQKIDLSDDESISVAEASDPPHYDDSDQNDRKDRAKKERSVVKGKTMKRKETRANQ
jgi:hypothetical protein